MSEKRIGTLIYVPEEIIDDEVHRMIHQWEDLISGLGLNLIMEVFIAENVLM